MTGPSARALDVVGTLARLGLAAVWLVSGALKAVDADQTYAAVRAYDMLSIQAASIVADVLPWFELAVGLLLLVGLGTRIVAAVSAGLVLVFMVGVTQAWVRGLAIDCGCFGGGGQVAPEDTSYGVELLRDAGFLLLSGWLIVRPRTLLSLDGVLAGPRRSELVQGGT